MTRRIAATGALALLTGCLLWIAAPLTAQAGTEATPAPIAITFGPGPFNLLNPAAGLEALASYHAALTLTFDGTRDGQPEAWSRAWTLFAAQNPPARQWTIETAGNPGAGIFRLGMDGLAYERRGEGDCTASLIQPDDRLAQIREPASFLSGVIGAEEAGTETVNGIASMRYTFGAQALGLPAAAHADGQMWTAVNGGALARYVLETTGGEETFGPGVEGTLRWDYQLTDVNQPLTLTVPPDCPSGLIDLPMLPDARNVVNSPGLTTYTSLTPLTEAAAFYAEHLTATGIESSFPPLISEAAALLEAVQDDQIITVILLADNGATSVIVTVSSNTPLTDANADAPESVTVQAEDGGSVDIPLPPDATDIAATQGILSYFSATEQAELAAFYQERLLAPGGQIYTPLNVFGGVAVMEITLGDYLLAINIRDGSDGRSVFIRVDPPGTFTPLTAPAATQAPPAPELPDAPSGDCVDGSAAMPILPNAAGLSQDEGVTSYATQTSVTDAAAFYMEQVTANGGSISAMMPTTAAMAMLEFTLGSQTGSIMILPAGGVNSVVIAAAPDVFGLPAAPCPTPASAAPQGVAPTASADACAVSAASSANQRSGPGTTFALVGTLAGGVSAPVLGQATGADGLVWWQLGDAVWVRSDVVTATGACDDVPIAQP